MNKEMEGQDMTGKLRRKGTGYGTSINTPRERTRTILKDFEWARKGLGTKTEKGLK